MVTGDRVLITGVEGFVGRHLASRMLALGFEVYGLAKWETDGREEEGLGIPVSLPASLPGVKLLYGDITDLTTLLSALDRASPSVIFHLAAQSFVPRSLASPLETFLINSGGTQNLLEAVRIKDLDCRVVFAGSAEEYGLQIVSDRHYEAVQRKYGKIFPEPQKIPELPIGEDSPLRPVSPYGVSKVHGDFLMRMYHHVYGLDTIVSRAFNHEGVGRGHNRVTSKIARQCVAMESSGLDGIHLGNVNSLRDWSHVRDLVDGYILLSQKGESGQVYVQGAMRANSVLTFLLLTLRCVGFEPMSIETLNHEKRTRDPLEINREDFFGISFFKTKVDALILRGELEYTLSDRGLRIVTSKGEVRVWFDQNELRQLDLPVLLSDTHKIRALGFSAETDVSEIIRDLVDYYRQYFKNKQVSIAMPVEL